MNDLVNIDELRPRDRDPVDVFWARLLRYAAQRDVVITDPNARVAYGPDGTGVIFEEPPSWSPHFLVSVTGLLARVGVGFVLDEMPTVDGIGLDGIDLDGEKVEVPEIPVIEGAGEDGRSFVCVRMLWDVQAGEPLMDAEDWLSIVHVADVKAARKDAGPGVGFEALAILYWDKKRIKVERVRQKTLHNLGHVFIPGEGEGSGTHHFSSV
ncbi:MAG: hypothetical protein QM496_01900 [Verrucomicrobiota bacterium]